MLTHSAEKEQPHASGASSACSPFSGSRQLASPADKIRKEFAVRNWGIAILHRTAWRLRPLGSWWTVQTSELIELRVDIHEWILVIMRGDEKNSGNVLRRECDHYPERSGEMGYTDLGEKVVPRQSVVKGCATLCSQCEDELVIRSPLLLVQLTNLLCGSLGYLRTCRHQRRLPTITAYFALLVESEGRTHITRLQL